MELCVGKRVVLPRPAFCAGQSLLFFKGSVMSVSMVAS